MLVFGSCALLDINLQENITLNILDLCTVTVSELLLLISTAQSYPTMSTFAMEYMYTKAYLKGALTIARVLKQPDC